ncbi:hypothetical protein YPPY59_1871, partial [Yersinia pestis PY-59]
MYSLFYSAFISTPYIYLHLIIIKKYNKYSVIKCHFIFK